MYLPFLQNNNNTFTPERIRPNWQERMLLPTWCYEGNDSAPDTVYRKVLRFCNIDFNHLTHLRSSAIEQASTWGLDVFRIATMSKHMVDKINRFYMSESNRDVLSMMSGFREEGARYYVPRTLIQVPFSHNKEYVTHIFPGYKRWLQELNSKEGDKDLSAKNFLHKVLPLLARVVIQDAPYHLHKYPNSPFSKFFRDKLCNPMPLGFATKQLFLKRKSWLTLGA